MGCKIACVNLKVVCIRVCVCVCVWRNPSCSNRAGQTERRGGEGRKEEEGEGGYPVTELLNRQKLNRREADRERERQTGGAERGRQQVFGVREGSFRKCRSFANLFVCCAGTLPRARYFYKNNDNVYLIAWLMNPQTLIVSICSSSLLNKGLYSLFSCLTYKL